jgi:hypothetical protein
MSHNQDYLCRNVSHNYGSHGRCCHLRPSLPNFMLLMESLDRWWRCHDRSLQDVLDAMGRSLVVPLVARSRFRLWWYETAKVQHAAYVRGRQPRSDETAQQRMPENDEYHGPRTVLSMTRCSRQHTAFWYIYSVRSMLSCSMLLFS